MRAITIPRTRRKRFSLGNRKGQALLLVVVAMGTVLVAGMGLAIDASQYYTHRTMAQAAADAAAEAAMMSILNSTNTSGTAAFSTSGSFTCTTSDARTPCVYARYNGFGSTADDTVTVSFPGSGAVPGVSLSSDPINVTRVTVSRTIPRSFLRLFGTNSGTIQAAGTAAITSQIGSVPILITHPTLNGAFSLSGNASVTICGGPFQSIQVNSSGNGGSPAPVSTGGSTTVDLSHAGPPDPGDCSAGTGGDFLVWGGPTSWPGAGVSWGTRPGKFISPSSPLTDPLASVAVPSLPTNSGTMGTATSLANGASGCPASPKKSCNLYHPGLWNKIQITNETAVFAPGVYYINGGGFSNGANGDIFMSSGLASDTDTGPGVLFYLTGSGGIDLSANSDATLVGSSSAGPYKGILFFGDRAAPARSHTIGGGGAISLTGTLYLNNTTMTSTIYQTLNLRETAEVQPRSTGRL